MTAGVVEPPLDTPADLSKGDLRRALKRTVREVKEDDVPNLAAGVAFKIFLSIFPSVLAAAAIYGLVREPSEVIALVSRLTSYLPPAATELVEQTLLSLTGTDEGAARGLAIAGVVGGLFSATGAAVSLMKALDRAYDCGESRKLLRLRLVGLIITVALFTALATLIGLIVLGPQLREALVPDRLDGQAIGFLFGVGRFVLAAAVLILLFAFVYWIGPDRERPEWQWLSPGAILGVLGWLAISACFTLYTQTLGNYQASYGSLAGVIVLLLWLQLSMLVMLAGAELNAELENVRTERAVSRHATLADATAGASVGLEQQLSTGLASLSTAEAPSAELPIPSMPTSDRRVQLGIAAAATGLLVFVGLARRTRRRAG